MRITFVLLLCILVAGCDNPNAPSTTIPRHAESVNYHLSVGLYRDWFLKVAFPDHDLVGVTHHPIFSKAVAPHYINFYCRYAGNGTLHVTLTQDTHFYGSVVCYNAFRPRVRSAFSLTAYFERVDGRTVKGIGVSPVNLARKIGGGAGSSSLGASTSSWPNASRNETAADEDISLECEEEGNGTLTVYFASTDSPSSESFPLECAPEHEQGSGG